MSTGPTRWATTRTVLGSSRPLSWVNTAFPFGAAYLLAGGGLDVAFWVGVLFFLVPYNVAMYGINDVFDHESDLRNPRKGGVEGALLDRGVHRLTLAAAALSSAPFLLALVLLGGRTSALALAVCALAVVAYSAPGLRFKEQPFLDSITSSTHFVGPAVFGLLVHVAKPDLASATLERYGLLRPITDRDVAPTQRRHLPSDKPANPSIDPAESARASTSMPPPGMG